MDNTNDEEVDQYHSINEGQENNQSPTSSTPKPIQSSESHEQKTEVSPISKKPLPSKIPTRQTTRATAGVPPARFDPSAKPNKRENNPKNEHKSSTSSL